MKKTHLITIVVLALLFANSTFAKDDDFKSVVKLIENFYGVKHEGIPFIARAGIKVAGAAAKVTRSEVSRLADLGSVKVATFEGQKFKGDIASFRSKLNASMDDTWSPLIQTITTASEEQVYIFLKNNEEKFDVLIITLEPNDGSVVQATLTSKGLAQLMSDPENASRKISQEATIVDQD